MDGNSRLRQAQLEANAEAAGYAGASTQTGIIPPGNSNSRLR
jgi:hypothetical protein